jgi:cytochrome c-type biogenesis protein CcmH
MLKITVFLLICLTSVFARAGIDSFEFSSEEKRERYNILVDELRCPKCKNNNLSGSNSMIAVDLKREIHTMVEAGKSNQEVADFMVARYGDFVLYRPRMTAQTALLWGTPIALFILAVTVVVVLVRGRAKALKIAVSGELSPAEQAQLAQLTRFAAEDSPSPKKSK